MQIAERQLRVVDPLMEPRVRQLTQVGPRQHAAQIAELLDGLAAARQHRERRTDLAHAESDRARKLRVLEQVCDDVGPVDAPAHLLPIHLIRGQRLKHGHP